MEFHNPSKGKILIEVSSRILFDISFLKSILTEPKCGKALKDELAGLRSFRVSRFKIIYHISKKKQIEIVAIGPRERIYQETFRMLNRNK